MTTTTKYKPEYCSEIIRLGTEGKTKTQMAAHFNVDAKTLLAWSRNPELQEFKMAYRLAQTLSQAYMEDLGMKGIKGLLPKFAPAPWIFSMKARFRDEYGDTDSLKVDMNNPVKGMTDEEIDKSVAMLLAAREKNQNKVIEEEESK